MIRIATLLSILLLVTSPAAAVPVDWEWDGTVFGITDEPNPLPPGPVRAVFTFEPVALGNVDFVAHDIGTAVLDIAGLTFTSTSLDLIYQYGRCPDGGCGGGQLGLNATFAGFGSGFFGDTAIDFIGNGSVYRTPPFPGWGQETYFFVGSEFTHMDTVFMRAWGGHFTDVTPPTPQTQVPAPSTLLLLASGLLLTAARWRPGAR